MGSSVGFKSAADEGREGASRKKTTSRGLIAVFGLLAVVLVTFGLFKMWQSSLKQQTAALESQITQKNTEIQEALSNGEVADFAVRARTMEEELYRGYDTNKVLEEIENIMILKESDGSGNRVVLKSFEHNAGAHQKKTTGGVTRTVTGMGSITISADADNFDVMAQQIEVFKQSEVFDNVEVGTTDRDESGRIIFTLTMNVKGYDKSPYEKIDAGSEPVVAPAATTIETDGVNVETSSEGDGSAGVNVETEDNSINVEDGNVNVNVEN